MRSLMTIDIAAPPELVFAVAGDPTRWPALLPHYRSAKVLRRSGPAAGGETEIVARYVAVRPLLPPAGVGLPVAWTSRFRADPAAGELHFRHVGGATAGMAVTWRIRAWAGGTRVTLEHDFGRTEAPDPRPGPSPGRWPAWLARSVGEWYPRFIERFFVRPIAGRTLATFRALCESLPPTWGADEGSLPPATEPADDVRVQVHAR